MNTQDDSISIYLACRLHLYKLLQHIFGHEPSKDFLDILTSEYTQEVLKLFLDEIDLQINEYNDLLVKLNLKMASNLEELLEKITGEYTNLFIGPRKLPAPPWESVYRSKERLIFQESTLLVRRSYLEYQYLPANYPHEADDHLDLELDFMAHLAQLTTERFENKDELGLQKVLLDQKEFLKNHLLSWITEFVDQIQISKTHYLYPQMAKLTEKVLRTDYAHLEELIDLLYPKNC